METSEKNCPNCKQFRKEEESTLLERDGKKVATQFKPKRCMLKNRDTMLEWFKTKKPIELKCFESQ